MGQAIKETGPKAFVNGAHFDFSDWVEDMCQ